MNQKKQDRILAYRLFFIIFLMGLSTFSFAGSNEFVLPKGHLVIFGPPVINKEYFLIEFGFLTEKSIKSWGYNYNAYVTATLFQDAQGQGKNRAGALGFKGGVILPTQPWVPFLLTASFGFAKTALQRNPFLGKDGSSVAQKDMIFLEAGAIYRIDNYFIRFAHQRSTVKYFKRHNILMFGVNY